jgi:hypothetical protein
MAGRGIGGSIAAFGAKKAAGVAEKREGFARVATAAVEGDFKHRGLVESNRHHMEVLNRTHELAADGTEVRHTIATPFGSHQTTYSRRANGESPSEGGKAVAGGNPVGNGPAEPGHPALRAEQFGNHNDAQGAEHRGGGKPEPVVLREGVDYHVVNPSKGNLPAGHGEPIKPSFRKPLALPAGKGKKSRPNNTSIIRSLNQSPEETKSRSNSAFDRIQERRKNEQKGTGDN